MKKYVIAAAVLMAGTAALAQTAPVAPTPPAPPPSMADHVMTRAEVVAMVRDHFGRLDANKDGSITTAEIGELKSKHPGGAWQGENSMHVMRDGPMGDPNAAFDRLDTNKDGVISRDEFAKAREQRIEKHIVMREEGAKDGKRHEMRMHHMGGGMGTRMIVMADTNKDGRITLAEAEALALQHFDQMDTNHDGQVTPEERRAARPAMMKQMRAPSAG
jgi:Ca2+-binding EF-hand superfamily protein